MYIRKIGQYNSLLSTHKLPFPLLALHISRVTKVIEAKIEYADSYTKIKTRCTHSNPLKCLGVRLIVKGKVFFYASLRILELSARATLLNFYVSYLSQVTQEIK